MGDSLMITCPEHGTALIPSGPADDPGALACPDATCATAVRIAIPDGTPFSPLTMLEQSAVQQHEFVCSREAAGFSRTEAMQLLCCIVQATIMKGSGSG